MNMHELAIRLLQDSWDGNVKVFVRDRYDQIHSIEAIEHKYVGVPSIQDSMNGPIANDSDILIIDVGPVEGKLVQGKFVARRSS